MWQEIDAIIPYNDQAAFYHAAANVAYADGETQPAMFQVGVFCQTLAMICERTVMTGVAQGRRFYYPEYDGTFGKIRFDILTQLQSLSETKAAVCDDAIFPAFEVWRDMARVKQFAPHANAVATPESAIVAEQVRADLIERLLGWAQGRVALD